MLAKMLIVLAGASAAVLAVAAVAMPLMADDSERSRLKAIRVRREQVRKESSRKPKELSLHDRVRRKTLSEKVSKRLNLRRFVNIGQLKMRLAQAGWRDPNTLPKFLTAHLVLPLAAGAYLAFAVYGGAWTASIAPAYRPAVVFGGALASLFLPSLFVVNATQRRQKKLSLQFPDALDLMLVCVEAGLSVDYSFMRITNEMGHAIPEVSEEFALTGAELSFLGDRPRAYVNLVERTMLPEFKALATVLSQAEGYGTSVSGALRSLTEDSRKMRMLAIEKKAGSLGPKMTIPMIVFILPCMFVVLLGPAVIQALRSLRGAG